MINIYGVVFNGTRFKKLSGNRTPLLCYWKYSAYDIINRTFPDYQYARYFKQCKAGKRIIDHSNHLFYIYVYIFLMGSLVPPKFKQYAVFFPNGKMPGATVFTKIKNKTVDVRFTPEDAKKRYAKEYAELEVISDTKLQQAKENSLWYRIYIHHIALYLLGIFPINKKCIIVLGTELVFTNIAARVKAKRSVYTVIAQDVHSKNVKAEKTHIK